MTVHRPQDDDSDDESSDSDIFSFGLEEQYSSQGSQAAADVSSPPPRLQHAALHAGVTHLRAFALNEFVMQVHSMIALWPTHKVICPLGVTSQLKPA